MTGREYLRQLSKAELDSFLDHATEIVMYMQPFKEKVEIVVDRVVDEEAEKMAKQLTMRERINQDMESRLHSPRPSTPPPVEDASVVLDRITKRIMAEKNLDYGAALSLAQRERKDLAEKILQQLEAIREGR